MANVQLTDDNTRSPQSLLAVTNWQSRALTPSEVYRREFIEWAHEHGAFLYLVLIGPKTEINGLERDQDRWKIRTHFHDGTAMKPRTIHVPFDLLPKSTTRLLDGQIRWTNEEGVCQRANAVELARWVLSRARAGGELDLWHASTLRKFFTYRVEYVGQSYGKQGERTSAERIGEGHKQVQKVLAEVADYHPNAAVALIVTDTKVQLREASFRVGSDNVEELARYMLNFMAEPDGPLVDESKLVTVTEDAHPVLPGRAEPTIQKLSDAGCSDTGWGTSRGRNLSPRRPARRVTKSCPTPTSSSR